MHGGDIVVRLHLGEQLGAGHHDGAAVLAAGLERVRRHARVGVENEEEVAVALGAPGASSRQGLAGRLDPRRDLPEVRRAAAAGPGRRRRKLAGLGHRHLAASRSSRTAVRGRM